MPHVPLANEGSIHACLLQVGREEHGSLGHGPLIVDDPVMGEGQRYRSDVAVTVFLVEPDAYDGGELRIETPFGPREVKLPAGSAVTYPASSLHEVKPVTRGERRVAVTWVQSLVRDPERRALLYELDVARQALRQVTPEADVTARVDHAYTNLVRMWADV